MIRTQIYLTPALHQYFRQLAKKNNSSMANEIRLGLEELRRKNKVNNSQNLRYQSAGDWLIKVREEVKRIPSQAPQDLAINMDKYLYGDQTK
jgi:hypothetical protein